MKQYTNPLASQRRKLCKRPQIKADQLESLMKEIFLNVKADGDKALVAYTAKFDGVDLNDIGVTRSEFDDGLKKVSRRLKRAIDNAYDNIRKFHEAQRAATRSEIIETLPGVLCWRETRSIEKVGLYVPGGSAPLLSTVLMLGIPAQIAGCKEIVLATPPQADGSIDPVILYAASKVGVTKIVKLGGAQAIAAFAIGTESVASVDKIFGPGNQYVTAAKLYAQKYGVAIDMPAGPSEVMVVADDTAEAKFVAADLLSQAEHGPDSQVVLLTTSEQLAKDVRVELAMQLDELARKSIAVKALSNSFSIIFNDLDNCISFANQYAPEHLILSVRGVQQYTQLLKHAGSVFLGNYSPESVGDYASGTNHTLPTGGWARSYGGVSVESFIKTISFQRLSKKGLTRLASTTEVLAGAEGLDAHARAVSIRLEEK